jgi:uncharacterized protein YndB with AHSA1/START domain
MAKHDWSNFTRRIVINAPLAAVYKAWTTPVNLETWFLRHASFRISNGELREKTGHIYSGDTYEWLWYGHPDTSVEKGRVIETNGVDTVKFSFSGGAFVSVHLEDLGPGETLVSLTQEEIPTDEHGKLNYNLECQVGWTFYLTNLKSILEGGLDLRNKDAKLKNVVNS